MDLLDEEIYISNQTTQGLVPFTAVSEYVRLLNETRNRRLGLNRVSVEADILKHRHSHGELGSIVPFRDFMDAELFLFLRTEFQFKPDEQDHRWLAFSTTFMADEPPIFLVEAERNKYASRLLSPLAVPNTDQLRAKLSHAIAKLNRCFGRPLRNYDSNKIASRA